MRVFLQHQSTHRYLTANHQWTDRIEEAHDFGSSLSAVDFMQRFKVAQSNIVLNFEDPKYDIILEIMAQRGSRPDTLREL